MHETVYTTLFRTRSSPSPVECHNRMSQYTSPQGNFTKLADPLPSWIAFYIDSKVLTDSANCWFGLQNTAENKREKEKSFCMVSMHALSQGTCTAPALFAPKRPMSISFLNDLKLAPSKESFTQPYYLPYSVTNLVRFVQWTLLFHNTSG